MVPLSRILMLLHLSVPSCPRLPALPLFNSAHRVFLTSLALQSTKLGEVLSCPQGSCDPEVEKKGTVTKNSDVQQNKEMPRKVEGKETVKCGELL